MNSDKQLVCTVCKRKGHSTERCWSVVGYPKWYSKPTKFMARGGSSAGKWSGQRNAGNRTGNVSLENSVNCTASDKGEMSNVVITHQQFE